jgi:tetratricopeptide repeat protein
VEGSAKALNVAGTLNNLGNLDRGQGRMEEARKEFAEALQIYETLARQNSPRFSTDVRRVKKLMEQLPNAQGP